MRFVLDEPPVFALLDDRQWKELSDTDRLGYDEARIDYHSRLIVVTTSTVRRIVTAGRRLNLLNRHAISARRGLIISGAAGTGKTTALTQLCKTHELLDRHHYRGHHDRIPVVYVTVPPAATARMLAVEFARFLGIPVAPRQNITDVTEAVCGVMTSARTGLVAIDEIHNISLQTRSGAEVSVQLKYFSERLPATFAYSGINVEREGLFTGTRGQQIAGRFSMIPTVSFPYQEEWSAVVATLEDALRLHHHTPGTLSDLDLYLHHRTKGMIGSLSHLIRGAAIEAVLDGSERITRATLDRIDLDYAADGEATEQ
nr:TniB family NTP-binding protein [Nocardia terpenica]